MPTTANDFLFKKRRPAQVAVYVAYGDEDFLRRHVHWKLRTQLVGPEPDDFTYAVHPGEAAVAANILDELFMPPFLGDQRLVVVEEADTFVTKFRPVLEKYVAHPSGTGTLLLDCRSWPASTKLAKAVEKSGMAIDCNGPKTRYVADWCVRWARERFQKNLDRPTASWLVELVGGALGMLDRELAKLNDYVGDRDEITIDDVQKLVAGTRTDTAFKLLDPALEGRTEQALQMLHRQLNQGESPVGILAMLTGQLRRLTKAARLAGEGQGLDGALREAGVPPFFVRKSIDQLQRLGHERMAGMYRRLLATDLDLKGGSQLSPRIVVEKLLLELAARERPPTKRSPLPEKHPR